MKTKPKFVAKLVTVSLTTRVVVPKDFTEEQIASKAQNRLIQKLEVELIENIEDIVDDKEVPFGKLPSDIYENLYS